MAVNRTNRDANFVVTGGLTLAAQKNLSNPVTFAGAGNFSLSPNFKPAQASIVFAVTGAFAGKAFFDVLYSDITKVSLSNNFLTATAINTSGANTSARSNASNSTFFPKLYCSAIADLVTGTVGFGICNASQANTTGLAASLNAVAYFADGTVKSNSVTLSTIATFTTDDILDMAVDFTNSRIWFRNNNGNWNNSGTANPATNAGGIDISSLNAGPYYVAVEVDTIGDQITVNFDGLFVPVADGVVALFYGDFVHNIFWYNGAYYDTFALWLTAIGGTFTRSTTATYIASTGFITTAAIDAIRFNYNPATLRPIGILMEGASTNLCLQSNTFNDAVWTATDATPTAAAATSPDGTVNGWKLSEGTAVDNHSVQQTVSKAASALTYTFSCYAKAAERTVVQIIMYDLGGFGQRSYFDLTNGIINPAGVGTPGGGAGYANAMTDAGNGWWLCSATGTTATDTSIVFLITNVLPASGGADDIYQGVSGDGVYIYGAQLAQAAFVSSYIPTTTLAVTRAKDVFTSTALTALMSGTGSSYAKFQASASLVGAWRLFGDTASTATTIFTDSASTNKVGIYDKTTTLLATLAGSGVYTSRTKAASSYSGSGRSIAANGGTIASDANTQPVLTGNAQIGGDATAAESFFGNIMQVGAWNIRITDTGLQSLTT